MATKQELSAVHSALTTIFIRVLERYTANLDKLDEMTNAEVKQEIDAEVEAEVTAFVAENFMPNPAMLGAITKFLKDNEIKFDDEEVNKLTGLARTLEERRKSRPKLVTLDGLAAVGE